MANREKFLFYNKGKIEVYKASYEKDVVDAFITEIIKKYRKSQEFNFKEGKEIKDDFSFFDEKVIHEVELSHEGYKVQAGIVHVYPILAKVFYSAINRKFGGYAFSLKPLTTILREADSYLQTKEDLSIKENKKIAIFNQYFNLYTFHLREIKIKNVSAEELQKAKENTLNLENLEQKGIKLLEKVK